VRNGLGQIKDMAQSNFMAKNTLQSRWQRHNWQTSPFAPELRIVQALVDGKTASGAGFARYDALARCLGETAEIMTLNKTESSEGLAAGPDFAFAAQHALSERLERWALWEWWHKSLKAVPVMAPDMIRKLRRNAVENRDTSLWLIDGFPHIEVAIALSRSLAGTQPILGFGANICPQKAAESALIELGLMEVNLLEPTARLEGYFHRILKNAPALFPASTPRPIKPAPKGANIESSLAAKNIKFTLHDRSQSAFDLAVVKAEIRGAPRWAGTIGPFL